MFKVATVYSKEDGNSHFEDIETALTDTGSVGKLSAALATKEIIFRENRNSPFYYNYYGQFKNYYFNN